MTLHGQMAIVTRTGSGLGAAEPLLVGRISGRVGTAEEIATLVHHVVCDAGCCSGAVVASSGGSTA